MNKIELEQQIISLIQLKPVLWQKEHPQHKNSVELSKAWDEVANAARQTKTWIRNKWKYLKKCMSEEIRSIGICRSGDEANNYESDWNHFDSMKFMIGQLTPNESLGNLTDLFQENNMDMSEYEKNQYEFDKISTEIMNSRTTKKGVTRKSKQDTLMELENKKLALLQKAIEKDQRESNSISNSNVSSDSENLDMMYFKTLLSYVQHISEEEKLLYRKELIQTTLKFAYKNNQATEPSTEKKNKNKRIPRNYEESENDDANEVEIVLCKQSDNPKKRVKIESSYLAGMKQEPYFSTSTYNPTVESQSIRQPERTNNNLNASNGYDNFLNQNNYGAFSKFNFIPVPIPYIPTDTALQHTTTKTSNFSNTPVFNDTLLRSTTVQQDIQPFDTMPSLNKMSTSSNIQAHKQPGHQITYSINPTHSENVQHVPLKIYPNLLEQHSQSKFADESAINYAPLYSPNVHQQTHSKFDNASANDKISPCTSSIQQRTQSRFNSALSFNQVPVYSPNVQQHTEFGFDVTPSSNRLSVCSLNLQQHTESKLANVHISSQSQIGMHNLIVQEETQLTTNNLNTTSNKEMEVQSNIPQPYDLRKK